MSSVSGVTRPPGWAKGCRVPAYTRFAPLHKASSTSALPMPRLAPVTRTALFAMIITVSSSVMSQKSRLVSYPATQARPESGARNAGRIQDGLARIVRSERRRDLTGFGRSRVRAHARDDENVAERDGRKH